MTLADHYILRGFARLLLCILLVSSSLMPSFALASGAPVNVANFLCNQTQVAAPDEAQAALTELLTLAGHIDPQDEISFEHCSACVLALHVFALPSFTLSAQTQFDTGDIYRPTVPYILHYAAQGPPLGGRAPPHFS